MPEFDFEAAKPDITDEEKKKFAELQTVEEPVEYKYSSIGRKLPVGRDGTWTRKSKLWRPWEIPEDYWRKHPEMHDEWRRVFPDPSRTPDEQTSAGVAGGDLQPDVIEWSWNERIPGGPRDIVV